MSVIITHPYNVDGLNCHIPSNVESRHSVQRHAVRVHVELTPVHIYLWEKQEASTYITCVKAAVELKLTLES